MEAVLLASLQILIPGISEMTATPLLNKFSNIQALARLRWVVLKIYMNGVQYIAFTVVCNT